MAGSWRAFLEAGAFHAAHRGGAIGNKSALHDFIMGIYLKFALLIEKWQRPSVIIEM